MKHHYRHFMLGSLALALVGTQALAQDPTTTPTTKRGTDGVVRSATATAMTAGTVVRGSSLIGSKIQDASGEAVGTVHDLVVGDQGSIEAVLVACDRFDDGYVAVPLGILTLHYEEARLDADGSLPLDRKLDSLVLNQTDTRMLESYPRTRLEAPLDAAFIRNVHARGGGGKDDVDRKEHAEPMRLRLASKVLDRNVTNESAEDVGEIEDLAVAVDRAEVLYAVMESGGILGMGQKRFAVPWTSLESPRMGSDKIQLDVTRESLAKAKGFEHWPATGDASLFRTARHTPTDGERTGSERTGSERTGTERPAGTPRRDG